MGRPAKRKKISLSKDEQNYLKAITRSKTEEYRKVQRARIILENIEGTSDTEISKKVNLSRQATIDIINKCLEMGVEATLKDIPRPGRPQEISDEEKKWIINIACEKPKNLGYSFELWTYTLLVKHIKKESVKKGYKKLKKISRSQIWNILDVNEIKPHKIRYYLERRDENFEEKMETILCTYSEVAIINSEKKYEEINKITVSYDAKPGIQAIGNTNEDLQPKTAGNNKGVILRDFEYERYGTVSLLAGINLHTGKITHITRDTHTSKDFIEWLEMVDTEYKSKEKIRIILDNHSAHISKETKKYLQGKQNRFEFVFTPKHGSWLNIIETMFSKMARSFLRGIRVSCKEELKERIGKYFKEINKSPVIFKWKYKLSEI